MGWKFGVAGVSCIMCVFSSNLRLDLPDPDEKCGENRIQHVMFFGNFYSMYQYDECWLFP